MRERALQKPNKSKLEGKYNIHTERSGENSLQQEVQKSGQILIPLKEEERRDRDPKIVRKNA